MSAREEATARDKQGLVERAALSRLQLAHHARDMRGALQWTRVAASAAPPVVRLVALAGQGLVYVRLLRFVINLLRGRTGQP